MSGKSAYTACRLKSRLRSSSGETVSTAESPLSLGSMLRVKARPELGLRSPWTRTTPSLLMVEAASPAPMLAMTSVVSPAASAAE